MYIVSSGMIYFTLRCRISRSSWSCSTIISEILFYKTPCISLYIGGSTIISKDHRCFMLRTCFVAHGTMFSPRYGVSFLPLWYAMMDAVFVVDSLTLRISTISVVTVLSSKCLCREYTRDAILNASIVHYIWNR